MTCSLQVLCSIGTIGTLETYSFCMKAQVNSCPQAKNNLDLLSITKPDLVLKLRLPDHTRPTAHIYFTLNRYQSFTIFSSSRTALFHVANTAELTTLRYPGRSLSSMLLLCLTNLRNAHRALLKAGADIIRQAGCTRSLYI